MSILRTTVSQTVSTVAEALSGGPFSGKSDGRTFSDPYHPFRSEALMQEYLAFYDARAMRWPITSEERLVETTFGTTFVRVQGPSDGPPFVLLPGDSENSLAWIPIIASLSDTYRTYALDHIYDCGRSTYRRRMGCAADLTQWLDEVLKALELNKPHLMGHSLGSWQTALYARDHPDALASLILLAPASTILPPSMGLLGRAIMYGLLPFRAYTKYCMYWYDPDGARGDQTRWMIDELIEDAMLARRCFRRRNLIPPNVLPDEDWQSITTLTLFLFGANEMTYLVKDAIIKLHRVAPEIQTAIAARADHHLTIVKPHWLTDKVLRFLSDQEVVK